MTQQNDNPVETKVWFITVAPGVLKAHLFLLSKGGIRIEMDCHKEDLTRIVFISGKDMKKYLNTW